MSTQDLVLGLDVGTTSAKASLFSLNGTVLAQGRARTPWRRANLHATSGASLGTELSPEALINAVQEAISTALQQHTSGQVVAVGVTSMGESGVLLDSSGAPIAPVIAWHDTRDKSLVLDLEDSVGGEEFSRTTGLPLLPQWSLTKHRWQQDNFPSHEHVSRRLSIAEWIVHRLGGEQASDISLASRTGWLDLTNRSWWQTTLEWSRTRESILPPLVDSGTPLGKVDSHLSRLDGAVLTTAGHDHQAAALGADATGPGDQLDSHGTAEALVRTVAPSTVGPQARISLASAGVTIGWHAQKDRWALLGATQGGLVLERIARLFDIGPNTVETLNDAARDITETTIEVALTDAGNLRIDGIHDDASQGEVWAAGAKQIVSDIGAVNQLMNRVAGRQARTISAGGWSSNPLLVELKRNVFGESISSLISEPGAWGAAKLALQAAEHI